MGCLPIRNVNQLGQLNLENGSLLINLMSCQERYVIKSHWTGHIRLSHFTWPANHNIGSLNIQKQVKNEKHSKIFGNNRGSIMTHSTAPNILFSMNS